MSVRKRTWTSAGEVKTAWVVDYTDGAGKRRLKTFTRKKDADAFAGRAKAEVADGVHVADRATVTVAEAAETWLRAAIRSGLESGTTDQYARHVRLHIVPFLGGRRLNEITVPLLRAYQDELRDGDAPRSTITVRLATATLGRVLAHAQYRGPVARNVVAEMARRPAPGARVEKRQKEKLRLGVDIPTVEEARAIVAAASGRHRPIIVTMIFTGLRASELFGLAWSDVDLEKGLLHVRQRADRRRELGAPKSAAGRRTVPLPPIVINTLREWKLACPKGEAGVVFPTTTGAIQSYHNFIRDGLEPVQLAAGVVREGDVAKYGMHALRHFYASWCINRKVDGGLELPAKAVQERMGHSSITMTMDTYGHLFPAQDSVESLMAAERALLGNAT